MLRKAAITLLAVMGLSLSGLLAACGNGKAESAAVSKPKILLMTSLPIIWGDGASMPDILSGESSPAPIYEHWRKQYDIAAVDSLEGLDKSGTDIVMLVQPKAMNPADLTDLDEWIRSGGRALIFTDPALMWHSDLPLGDSQRPLASGLLSPLFTHWGLLLKAPEGPENENVELIFEDFQITTAGVGSFALLPDGKAKGTSCVLSDANVIAQCAVGKGQVILVADADFVDEAFWVNDRDWEEQGKSGAMRFTDALVADFGLNATVSND